MVTSGSQHCRLQLRPPLAAYLRRLTTNTKPDPIFSSRVHDHFLGEDLARGIEDARAVAAIPKVQSDGQFFTSR